MKICDSLGIGADVINIHMGGVYGDKESAVRRFLRSYNRLPGDLKQRLTLENDDKNYTPADTVSVHGECGIPLVYDVHHHRCKPDNLSVEEATEHAIRSWTARGREPYFHISSPKNSWSSAKPTHHSDFIDFKDFPECWLKLKQNFTLDVEAKSKELAVLQLKRQLESAGCIQLGSGGTLISRTR